MLKDIKTGETVVRDFLDTLISTEHSDAATVMAIKDLYDIDKLTTTKLEQSLTQLRNSPQEGSETRKGDAT